MSDWKEITEIITEIIEITVQPLLKLSSDQCITLIIHLIFIILNSFQPFFSYAGISILASCYASAPTSLRVYPEQKALHQS